jgi:hypothetical protein
MDYQSKKCDTLNLTTDCSKILDCVQKEKQIDTFGYLSKFITFLLEEIQENGVMPLIFVGVLLIYQLVENGNEINNRVE